MALNAFIKKSKTLRLVAEGNSMLPVLQPKDLVFYERISPKKILINDLILIYKKRRHLVHRVIYKNANYLIAKGDNNHLSDGKIFPNQIVARVTKIKRGKQIFDHESQYLIQSTLYFQEIVKIKKALEKVNINFIFLKGLPLHLYFEKTQPKRLYADVDILIHPDHIYETIKLLRRFGYKTINEKGPFSRKTPKNSPIEINFVKNTKPGTIVFDVHYQAVFMMTKINTLGALYQKKLIDKLTIQMFKNKRFVKINSNYFPILNDQYLIIYLALHFFHHNFRGTFRLDLLDKIIRKEKLTPALFNSLTKTIKKYQLQNFIYPTFILLKKYYKTPLPGSFIKSIEPSNLYSLSLGSKIYHQGSIFDDEPRIQAGITRFKNLFFLSPRPWFIKIWVFINPHVLYFIFLLVINKVRRKLS